MSGGSCVDRHVGECQDWIDQQTCDEEYIVPLGDDLPDLSHCTEELSYDYDGHGGSEDELQECIEGIVDDTSGNCPDLSFLLEGCNDFADYQDWIDWAEAEIMGSVGPDQTVTITGNQCISSDANQVGQCTITVTCSEVTISLPECGGSCLNEGDTQDCGDASSPTTETCCCNGGSCSFQEEDCETDGDGDGIPDEEDQCPEDDGGDDGVCDTENENCPCIISNKLQCGPENCAGCEVGGPIFDEEDCEKKNSQ